MNKRKIRVAITHGDTNGIGYELIFKTFVEPEMLELCTPIIYGSPKIAAYHRKALDLQANFSIINNAEDARDGRVNLLTCFDEEVKVDMGVPTAESGAAALKALDRAMTDYRDNAFDVLVSCPVCNSNMSNEDVHFKTVRHYIQTCIGEGKEALSIYINDFLRIASATEDLTMKDVAPAITSDNIISKTKILFDCMKRDFMLSEPRVALLGLNPNADGDEELQVIAPAIKQMAENGIYAFGPYRSGEFFDGNQTDAFDGILAMYDSQASIPFHTLASECGIVYIAGLPLVCTAPSQGPSFSIAGKGQADETSLRHAIFEAIDIYRNRKNYDEPFANPLQKLYHERRDESEKARFSVQKKQDKPELRNKLTIPSKECFDKTKSRIYKKSKPTSKTHQQENKENANPTEIVATNTIEMIAESSVTVKKDDRPDVTTVKTDTHQSADTESKEIKKAES